MGDKSMKIVSAVIVSVGENEYLYSCLDSLKKQTHPVFEIIVMDNSTDKQLSQSLTKRYPEVHLYRSQENIFYGRALNIGIANSRGDFLLCLNDDVCLAPYFIQQALVGFERDALIGMVSGKILRSDRRTIDSTGLFLSYCRTAKERGYGRRDVAQFEQAGYVFGVSGAVAFYRRKMLEVIKEDNDYFDPSFRMFYEDVDIAWRAQRGGWKAFYIPGALAFHVRGASARAERTKKRGFARNALNDALYAELLKNRYLTIIKNESFIGLLVHLPGIIAYDFVAWIICFLSRPQAAGIFFRNIKVLQETYAKRKKRKPLF